MSEYFPNQGGYDHKWADITLYEPHPVRMWRSWHFELSSRFSDWSGDIADSTKITLSGRAKTLLEEAADGVVCSWPEVESDSIFFSFSKMGHDKVIEHGPPYEGVWLRRLDDHILETVTDADWDVLSLGAGLLFLFVDGQLIPQQLQGTCQCNNVESHLRRVRAMLRLSHFVRTGEITFVPHPAYIPGWYVAV